MTFTQPTSTTVASIDGTPVFDYSSRDFSAIFDDLVARIPNYLPEWTSQSDSDFGIVLLQLFAYAGDLLHYYTDRIAGEAFIQTATQAVSVLNLAAMLDYHPTLSQASSTSVQFTIGTQVQGPLTIPEGTQVATVGSATQDPILFETTQDLVIAGANSATPATAGIVEVLQGVTFKNESVATSDGSINQIYSLAYHPVISGSFQVFVDLGLGPQLWTFVPSLIDYGPKDTVFTDFVDANGVFYIVFGDGVNGYVPPLGSPITCTYRVGVGAIGNVGPNTIIEPVSSLIGVISVTNLIAANGGADPESLQSVRENAPASLKTLARAITESDWTNLAEQVAGVQWASTIQATYQLVNLYICPVGGGNPTPALLQAVQEFIDSVDMANTTVTLQNPTYVPVDVTVEVYVLPNYGAASVQQSVTTALNSLLALTSNRFGKHISLGAFYQTILAVSGVDYATITICRRQWDSQLTSALVNGVTYTSLPITPLPHSLTNQDVVVTYTTDANGNVVNSQSWNVNPLPKKAVEGGSTAIPVSSQAANANYPAAPGVTYVGTSILPLIVNAVSNGTIWTLTFASALPSAVAAGNTVMLMNFVPEEWNGTYTIASVTSKTIVITNTDQPGSPIARGANLGSVVLGNAAPRHINTFDNEIPVAGTFTVTTFGGIQST